VGLVRRGVGGAVGGREVVIAGVAPDCGVPAAAGAVALADIVIWPPAPAVYVAIMLTSAVLLAAMSALEVVVPSGMMLVGTPPEPVPVPALLVSPQPVSTDRSRISTRIVFV